MLTLLDRPDPVSSRNIRRMVVLISALVAAYGWSGKAPDPVAGPGISAQAIQHSEPVPGAQVLSYAAEDACLRAARPAPARCR